jgi:Mrp family chromosome partitioning ATPase
MHAMNSFNVDTIELLGRIAEIKRIYSVIDSSVTGPACIVVTSGAQGEGKSTLAAGLAIAAARREDRRVLLVDFNWHAPSLHRFFDVDLGNQPDAYVNGGPIQQVVRQTKVHNLDLLPALREEKGSVNGSRSLPSPELLKKAKAEYDMVIIDTSPAFPTNQRMIDPVEISKLSDGVVLVTLTNVTPRQELKRACTAIETAGANILGVVANQWQNPIV